MAEPEGPQLYLVTPPEFELSSFPERLARVLDARPTACLRLAMATRDEDRVARAADALREVAHARDVAIVVSDHTGLAERLGLDGVHLTDGARRVRKARETLGPDAIVGSFCGALRHDGMTAGEAGADYVAFGPVADTGLGGEEVATHDLFAWWSEMIEIPVVAEGALDAATVAALAGVTDFWAVGEEIWRHDDPLAALDALLGAAG
ncbi:thiamine phosphate synthase [Mesobaculum littorinae]|uniref:Thiamine phosphate synthase n=1 Tax=Mesobaculum littorinae TaxID=2486419 RepID=A0A438AM18_9RHOB|nr:thiamine phosphate synthase [Mesobaculum littorinae]RVV99732.1 thiamine phosphate synthase [Mesobaculum littorinae]